MAAAWWFASPPAVGQCLQARLLASDGAEDSWFGAAVDRSGDVVIVGAYENDLLGRDAGSAYIYEYEPNISGWQETAMLRAPDGAVGDWYGWAVSVDGGVAAVGAPTHDSTATDAGAVYVYRYDDLAREWRFEQKLAPGVLSAGDYIGETLAVSGDVIVAGAFGDDGNGYAAGAVHVFRYDPFGETWVHEDVLRASDGGPNDELSRALALEGDVMLVGAARDDDRGTDAGAAYVFRYDPQGKEWFEEAKLRAPDGTTNDQFGSSVDISENLALIGAWRDEDLGVGSGSASVFRFNNGLWQFEQKLLAPDGGFGHNFGTSVAIEGGVALIGAPASNHAGSASGSAYIFTRAAESWTFQARIIGEDVTALDFFGDSLALSGVNAVVGAPLHDVGGVNAGSAYAFEGILDCAERSLDLIFIIDGSGSISGDEFERQRDAVVAGLDALPHDSTVSVAVIQFSSHFVVEVPLTIVNLSTYPTILDDLDAMSRIGGGTTLTPALRHAAYIFENEAVGESRHLLIATDGGVSDPLYAEKECRRMRRLPNPVTICTALVRDECPWESELLMNCANVPEAPEFYPDEPIGRYKCFDRVCDFEWLCSWCLYPFVTRVPADGFAVPFGLPTAGVVEDTCHSDDAYVSILQRAAVSPLLPVIRADFETRTSAVEIVALTVTIETAATAQPVLPPQRLLLYDFHLARWSLVDERLATWDDGVVTFTTGIDPLRFVDDIDGTMKLRIDWMDPGAVISPNWNARIDQVQWELLP